MFTGIVETTGLIRSIRRRGPGVRLTVDGRGLRRTPRPGDSVAIDGVCLTVVRGPKRALEFDAIAETVRLTTLGRRKLGDAVNLEGALRVGDTLGGHFVQGHVDGTGTLRARHEVGGGSVELDIDVGPLARGCVHKGSIALDGISLTIARLRGRRITVAIIPTTLAVTTLGARRPGDLLNVEVDLIGKWIATLVPKRFKA